MGIYRKFWKHWQQKCANPHKQWAEAVANRFLKFGNKHNFGRIFTNEQRF